jgi:hypothetical protein
MPKQLSDNSSLEDTKNKETASLNDKVAESIPTDYKNKSSPILRGGVATIEQPIPSLEVVSENHDPKVSLAMEIHHQFLTSES